MSCMDGEIGRVKVVDNIALQQWQAGGFALPPVAIPTLKF